ncbi:MAG: hypothetical protein H6836_05275 [Planctomycetes bacterium]|nr:hypothetical protein [Planctomycetota bacterium]
MLDFHPFASLSLAALLAVPVAAQCDFGPRGYTFPDKVANVLSSSDVPTWLVTVDNHPNEIWGGSTRTQKDAVKLTGSAPFVPLLIGRNPYVVQETNTGKYFGLNWYGDFVPLTLNGPAAGSDIYFSQDLMCIVEGKDVHVFGYWAQRWEKLTTNNTPLVVVGRGCLNVQDGNTIWGFSMATLGKAPPAKFVAPIGPVSHIIGTGESLTRRNQQGFSIDAAQTQAVVYSAFTHAFHPVSFARTIPVFEYDKNTILMQDQPNKLLHFFSAHSGQLVTGAFPNYDSIIFNGDSAQDNGIAVHDPIAKEAVFFRGIDDGVVVKTGADVLLTDTHTNNLWLIQLAAATPGSVEFFAVSSTKRGSVFQPAGLAAGEVPLKSDANDMCAVVATDKAIYGYSAFSGKWTRATIKGTFDPTMQKMDAEDFFGYVESSTHVYAFNPREDKWSEHTKGTGFAGIPAGNEDQMVVIDETTSASVYSMESTGFRTQNFTGTRFFVGDDNLNSCFPFVYDNPTTLGTTVYWWQGYADRWVTYEMANRVTDKGQIIQLEDGMIILDGKSIHTFPGFADLSSDYSAPNDNNAYQAIPLSSPKFVANGRPGATVVLLIGLNRVDVSVPGWKCNLLIDPNLMVIQPMGTYGADGTLRFQFTVPQGTNPGVVRMQMASDLSGALELGRLLNLELF